MLPLVCPSCKMCFKNISSFYMKTIFYIVILQQKSCNKPKPYRVVENYKIIGCEYFCFFSFLTNEHSTK